MISPCDLVSSCNLLDQSQSQFTKNANKIYLIILDEPAAILGDFLPIGNVSIELSFFLCPLLLYLFIDCLSCNVAPIRRQRSYFATVILNTSTRRGSRGSRRWGITYTLILMRRVQILCIPQKYGRKRKAVFTLRSVAVRTDKGVS